MDEKLKYIADSLGTREILCQLAEGGKRGGKNVINTLAFCTRLETHPNRLHLIAGVSTATAIKNGVRMSC